MGQLGTKDPQASDVHYVQNLVAPDTIGPMPEETMLPLMENHDVLRDLPYCPPPDRKAQRGASDLSHLQVVTRDTTKS